MESNSNKLSKKKISKFLSKLPPPISYLGALLEFLGWKNLIFFLSGFVLMNLFIYIDYVPWAKFIKHQTRVETQRQTESNLKQQYFLSGTVIDDEKNPIKRAKIRVQKDSEFIEKDTDDEGYFDFDLSPLKVEVGDLLEILAEKKPDYEEGMLYERFKTGISIKIVLKKD